MDPDRPVICMHDKADQVWRIQCDERTHTCVFSPNDELDADGRPAKALEQARDCTPDASFDRAKLEAAGYKFVPGRADAPWGWTRDERGRVFQTNFDLRRRLYFGAAYSPQKILENPFDSKRTSIDFGLLVLDIFNGPESPGDSSTRHRLRFVQGEVHLEPFSAELVLAHYDMSHHFIDPLLRITTFVGEPARHDLHFDVGLWSEAGGLEIHRTPVGNSELWRHATAQGTLDLWQSANLDSFARIRSGLGLEGEQDPAYGYRSGVTLSSAFEIDSVLDREGRQNIKFELSHELPRYFTPLPGMSQYVQRFRAKLQYEAVVLAINDQPITLKLAAGGERRNDLPGVPDQWAFVADAGLRLSLWAPPRPR